MSKSKKQIIDEAKIRELEQTVQNLRAKVGESEGENMMLAARLDKASTAFKEQEKSLSELSTLRAVVDKATRTLAKLACGHEQYDNAAKMRQTAAEAMETIIQIQNGVRESCREPRRFFGLDFSK